SGFTFTWSNGMTGRCANGLFAGEYTVTISDGLGCDIVETVIIDGGPVIETEILALMGVSCHEGTADGAIALIASGGANPSGQYTFAINGGTPQIGNVVSFANLQGGPNTLTVSYNTPLGNVCTKSEII
ncbi:hypothetical protein RZS08_24685, partial [Arthrospira platensis SPKY1]|nr:hypothetical protein [Arthrospira platensis SPKY1]